MTALDNKFFEAYKLLEERCNEIYSAKSGVSEYIADMERHMSLAASADFERTYKSLKHLRWLRNQIAHNASGGSFCKKEDYDALKGFYTELLRGEDPLTRLKAAKKRTAAGRKKENGGSVWFLAFGILITVFILIAIAIVSR